MYALAFFIVKFWFLTMLNCEKNYKVVFFYLFTYNLACLNQILFGKECCKFDTFCLF